MAWIIGIALILAVISFCSSSKHEFADVIAGLVVGAFFGLCVWLTLGVAIGAYVPTKTHIDYSRNIYTLEDNFKSSGRFVLGTGYMNQRLQYYYMEESERGLMVKSVSASDCYIKIIEDDSNPRFEVTVEIFENDLWNLVAVPIFLNTNFTLYVPENTVKSNYNIDLN